CRSQGGRRVPFSSDHVRVIAVSGLVVNAESAADGRLSGARGIKGETEARTNVPVIDCLTAFGHRGSAAFHQSVTEAGKVVNLACCRVLVQVPVGAENGCRCRA